MNFDELLKDTSKAHTNRIIIAHLLRAHANEMADMCDEMHKIFAGKSTMVVAYVLSFMKLVVMDDVATSLHKSEDYSSAGKIEELFSHCEELARDHLPLLKEELLVTRPTLNKRPALKPREEDLFKRVSLKKPIPDDDPRHINPGQTIYDPKKPRSGPLPGYMPPDLQGYTFTPTHNQQDLDWGTSGDTMYQFRRYHEDGVLPDFEDATIRRASALGKRIYHELGHYFGWQRAMATMHLMLEQLMSERDEARALLERKPRPSLKK